MKIHCFHCNKPFFIRTYTVKKLVLLIPGYCLQHQVIWNVFKIIGFQLFIHEKLQQILNFMLICVIKVLSFLIVYATIE